jgi:hypothetical protein
MLGSAIEILDACRKADIQNVAFAALTVDAAVIADTAPSAAEEEPG